MTKNSVVEEQNCDYGESDLCGQKRTKRLLSWWIGFVYKDIHISSERVWDAADTGA